MKTEIKKMYFCAVIFQPPVMSIQTGQNGSNRPFVEVLRKQTICFTARKKLFLPCSISPVFLFF